MDSQNDVVVLVHGLGGSRIDMWPISSRLKRLGYEVRNWGYRSLGNRVETHARRLGKELSLLDGKMSDGQLHLVTHSMGGIIARTMFADFEFKNLGRVVMLAPPHRGSHMARKLTPLVGWLTPSLEQLSDSADSFVNQLPSNPGLPVGIIAARYDTVVRLEATHLPDESDHLIMPCLHSMLLFRRDVAAQIRHFLAEGQFDSEAAF